MDLASEIYPGGFYELMRRLERREAPFRDLAGILPPEDVDLLPLFEASSTCTAPAPEGDRQDARVKEHALQQEFDGQPAVLALHAMLIVILRRRESPEEARRLFLRLWREHGAALTDLLTTRWRIAAATTFADHGDSVEQRLCGQGLAMLFDLIKLHESERRLSGRPGSRLFRRQTPKEADSEMPLGLVAYAFRGGDLDKNLLARLWRLGEADPVIQPLALAMLREVMSDPRTIFARVQKFKRKDRWFDE